LKLKEYREAGLTNFSSAKMYDYLKQQRDKERTQQRFLADILQHLEVVPGIHITAQNLFNVQVFEVLYIFLYS